MKLISRNFLLILIAVGFNRRNGSSNWDLALATFLLKLNLHLIMWLKPEICIPIIRWLKPTAIEEKKGLKNKKTIMEKSLLNRKLMILLPSVLTDGMEVTTGIWL